MEKVRRGEGVWSKARGWPEPKKKGKKEKEGRKRKKNRCHFSVLERKMCKNIPPVLLYSMIRYIQWLWFFLFNLVVQSVIRPAFEKKKKKAPYV